MINKFIIQNVCYSPCLLYYCFIQLRHCVLHFDIQKILMCEFQEFNVKIGIVFVWIPNRLMLQPL